MGIEWILIMILSHGSYDSGITVEKVVFNNEKECSKAADHTVRAMSIKNSAYKWSRVFCIVRSKVE